MKSLGFFMAFLFAMPFTVLSQYYLGGQDPASVKWLQLRTENFRIIFPAENTRQARKLALSLETTYPIINSDLNAGKVKTDLIFHNRSVISNAMVAWAPRRMDFFITPPQDGYPQDWLTQLSIHELRHIAQISSLNKGFTKGLSYLTGQQGTAAVLGLFIPSWLMEGDAVAVETALSFAGRGRDPLFEAGLKAQLLEKGRYSYDKAYFGSYQDHVPNIYELGYQLVSESRMHYGPGLWNHVFSKTARKPYLLKPFSGAIKDVTGMGKNRFYKAMIDSISEKWQAEDTELHTTNAKVLVNDRYDYVSYQSPRKTSYGIALIKSSMDDIKRIVLLKDGKEKLAFTPGPLLQNVISANDSLIVWSEFVPDIRWSNQDFSQIVIGDLSSGKKRTLSRKTRYFAPAVNKNGDRIAATETDIYGLHSLLVLESNSGDVLFRLSSDSLFFSNPQWLTDQINVVVSVTGKGGNALWLVNSHTAEHKVLIPFMHTHVKAVGAFKNKVLVSAAWSGIQNLYSIDLKSNTIKQLSSSRFGADDGFVDEQGDLYLSEYTSDGWKPALLKSNEQISLSTDPFRPRKFEKAEILSQQFKYQFDSFDVDDSINQIKPYRRLSNLFNIHSWSPFYVEASSQESSPGLMLMSQNTLSTMVAEMGYKMDVNEETGKFVLNMSYYGLYPVITAGYSYGDRRGKAVIDGKLYNLYWWEQDWNLGMRVPLNFSRGKWNRGLQVASSVQQLQREMAAEVGLSFKEEFVTNLTYEVFLWNQTRRSVRDIFPRFGQSFRYIFRHLPFQSAQSQQMFVSGNLFFPGLMPNHGIRLYVANQLEQGALYSFGSYIRVPRGLNQFYQSDMFAFKADYAMPLMYPDLGIPTVFYLKRIWSSVFFDYLKTGRHYRTVGLELHSEWNVLQFPAPINLGGRISWTINGWVPEMIFGINFSSLY